MDVINSTEANYATMLTHAVRTCWHYVNGSIRDNMNMKLGCRTMIRQVIQAAKAAHVHQFVKTLPRGYHMELNEEANNLPRQEQVLTIARAILADQKILILDEATSSDRY